MEKYFRKVLYPNYDMLIIFTDKEMGFRSLTRKEVMKDEKLLHRIKTGREVR